MGEKSRSLQICRNRHAVISFSNLFLGTKKMEASQEMVALGLCQVLGSCTGSLPITASFGRSAVNSSSGVSIEQYCMLLVRFKFFISFF